MGGVEEKWGEAFRHPFQPHTESTRTKGGRAGATSSGTDPREIYKDEGWNSWGGFLGFKEGYVPGGWRTFEEAQEYVWTLGLESHKEWEEWRKSGEVPHDIPAAPHRVYEAKGWKSWGDFLGYRPGHIAKTRNNIETRSFEEAREYATGLGLPSTKEWVEWSKSGERPSDIPSNPHRVYKGKGWKSWGDFLGFKKGNVAGEWRGFEEAREYARSLGFVSHEEWEEWRTSGEVPHDIPAAPHRVYEAKGWKSYGDFLGYRPGYVAGEWRDFEVARGYVRSLNFASKEEWWKWSKSGERPSDIPSSPDRVYKGKGWKSYGDFLGYRQSEPIAESPKTNRNTPSRRLRSI